MLIDTHAHLDFNMFDDDRDAVIERARSAGVDRMLNPGIDVATSRAAIRLSEQYPMIRAAVGIHPNSAAEAAPGDIVDIAELAAHPNVLAIGEIGLDFYRDRTPREVQVRAFRGQLDLARELDLPVIVHFREVESDGIELVGRDAFRGLRGVFHCFGGSAAFAEEVLGMGFYLGFDGPLTYKNSDRAAIAAMTPLDRCLIETDAPFLTPQRHRGERNEPAYVGEIAEMLASVKDLGIDEVQAATSRNARELFSFSG